MLKRLGGVKTAPLTVGATFRGRMMPPFHILQFIWILEFNGKDEKNGNMDEKLLQLSDNVTCGTREVVVNETTFTDVLTAATVVFTISMPSSHPKLGDVTFIIAAIAKTHVMSRNEIVAASDNATDKCNTCS